MKKIYYIRLAIAVIIAVAATAAATGFYFTENIFNLQLAPIIHKNMVNLTIVSVIILLLITILTAVFGRIYCSIFCPLGFFQETICMLTKKEYKKTKKFPLNYIFAIPAVGLLLFGSAYIIKYLEPYTIFASAFSLSKASLIIIAAIILICIFKGRFFCTNICPVGTVLGLVSQCAMRKITIDKNACISCGNCERNCQAECIDSKEQTVDNETCIKCLKCLTICPKDSIHYTNEHEKEKFSPERRKLIIAGVATIIIGGAAKAGLSLLKTANKIKNIILPPGAGNPEEFLTKCLNCNLCVKHCSEKIIKPADDNFGAPHIEYGDFGHCKFNCHKCGEVCPAGAIKQISMEEKQKTRIAIATINKEKCINCGLCEIKCPKKTILRKADGYEINGNNCIGCGVCAAACPGNAIEIFAVKEQKVI